MNKLNGGRGLALSTGTDNVLFPSPSSKRSPDSLRPTFNSDRVVTPIHHLMMRVSEYFNNNDNLQFI